MRRKLELVTKVAQQSLGMTESRIVQVVQTVQAVQNDLNVLNGLNELNKERRD